jgi:beta-galactosidase
VKALKDFPMPRPTASPAIRAFFTRILAVLAAFTSWHARGQQIAPLPNGVREVWDTSKAWRESTASRERVCLNGLWRWRPAARDASAPPTDGWGHFKVPGAWPGVSDYMQKDSQTVFRHPAWRDATLGQVEAAWYQREIDVPTDWSGRRVTLSLDTLNSFAAVFLNGAKVGELRFPGGELDLTPLCRPGERQTLSLLVVALPMQGVVRSYTDSAAAREIKGEVRRRGLCGDVFLCAGPAGPSLDRIRIETSVREGTLAVQAGVARLAGNRDYAIRTVVRRGGRVTFDRTSDKFQATAAADGRLRFAWPWKPAELWDLNTPTNQFDASVTLLDASGAVLDEAPPVRFGFRELWIDGRDFRLNGTRFFLSALPIDNAQIGPALATYDAARETLERLKSFGINGVYTHHYDCLPGAHLALDAILRAADDAGVLVALTQPHLSHYDWKTPAGAALYAEHAAWYAAVAGSHPSVVFYATSHNATGYEEDMNPDLIDGIHAPRDRWSSNNAVLALRVESIIRAADPSRIVYHHASGNLGAIHSINFYPNMVPPQELDDWFAHWAEIGVKPAYMCEYGAPFTWDWTMYRGFHKGRREFGSAEVPWEFCVAEWNAQFLGDSAYRLSEPEKANLRWEARQFAAGKRWHRWDYPADVGSDRLTERYPILAQYLSENWRAFRTWGVSGTSPWEYGHYWKLRDGVQRGRRELPVDWDNLQRPGFSPDFEEDRFERMDVAYARADWVPTPAAAALYRNNRPHLAYLAGKSAAFTSKDHHAAPGEAVAKQFIIINGARSKASGSWKWRVEGVPGATGDGRFTVDPGEQLRVPVRFAIPTRAGRSALRLTASAKFDDGDTQDDAFDVDVVAPPPKPAVTGHLFVFDPKGETAAWLRSVGVSFDAAAPDTPLSATDTLLIGKGALTASGPAPALTRVRDGLKVVVFEQNADALEKRLGFRIAEYGLRRVFPRLPDHPVVQGFGPDALRDWNGESTLLAPRLAYTERPQYGPTVEWCGLPVPRLWRCGNRGDVASVLIEKPQRGDFLPVVDGGFDLQYGGLLEFREGRGLIVFCQLDVTARSETDLVAATIASRLLEHVDRWKSSPVRSVVYAGEPAGAAFLESIGLSSTPFAPDALKSDMILVAGPGAGPALAANADKIRPWLAKDGRLVAFGLDAAALAPIAPGLETKSAEHLACVFDTPASASFAAGIGPSDTHLRAPFNVPLVAAGAAPLGDGFLGSAAEGHLIVCAMAPWRIDPKGPDGEQENLRRSRRRTAFLASRLLSNLGAAAATPLLDRFNQPAGPNEKRWSSGLYIDTPVEEDDPYRHFRW